MFSGLRENSPIFILTKGEKPALQVGTVVSVSNPNAGFGSQVPMFNQGALMEVTVKVGEDSFDLKSLPCQQSTHFYAKENAFVTDNRQEMLAEVENMHRTSTSVLESMSTHSAIVSACEEMRALLDPQIAKDKANQEQIDSLKDRMGGIENTLSEMMGLLQQSLNESRSKKPKE